MDLLKIEIEEALTKYYDEIKNKVLGLIKANNNRYFAYMVLSGTDHCEAEGWEYEINYKAFDEKVMAAKFESYGYTVIDCGKCSLV